MGEKFLKLLQNIEQATIKYVRCVAGKKKIMSGRAPLGGMKEEEEEVVVVN